jgi:hypothetical protein
MINYLIIVIILIQIIALVNGSSIQNMFDDENEVSNSEIETSSGNKYLRRPSSITTKPVGDSSDSSTFYEDKDDKNKNELKNDPIEDFYVVSFFRSQSSSMNVISSMFRTLSLFFDAPNTAVPSFYYVKDTVNHDDTSSSANDDEDYEEDNIDDDDDEDDEDDDGGWYAEDQAFINEANAARSNLFLGRDSSNENPPFLSSFFGPLFF